MKQKQLLLITIISFLCVGLLLIYFQPSFRYGLLTTIFLLLIYLIIKYIDIGIYLFIVSIFILFFITSHQELLPSYFNWLYDFLILSIFISAIINKNKKIKLLYFDYLLIILLLLLLVKEIINENNIIYILFGLRDNFRLILIYYVFRLHKFKDYQYKNFFKLILLLTVFQVPIAIMQYLKLLPLKAYNWDYFCGTLGKKQTGTGMIMILIINIIIFKNFLKSKKSKYVFMIIFLSLYPIIGSAKAYFLFLPISLMMLYVLKEKSNIIKILMNISLLAIIIFILNYLYINIYDDSPLNTITNKYYHYIYDFSFTKKSNLRRPEAIFYTMDNVILNQKSITGYGISKFRTSIFGDDSDQNEFYIYNKIDKLKIFADFPLFILKIGFLGTFLFFITILTLTEKKNRKLFITKYFFIDSYTINTIIIIMILSSIYSKPFINTNAAAIFWIIIGIYKSK